MSAADPRRRELADQALKVLEADGVLDVVRQALLIEIALREVASEFERILPLLTALDGSRRLADQLEKMRTTGGPS